ncbi:F-box domain containing protein [Parasponia andersonii]|uniref:F-box domain containing protein n=1 Tax=Parasponia andersonii TaxID=3476 RepID=A0A2P5D815_PARAD|nr:F-box domain containing protein [Parasponia andersonii]
MADLPTPILVEIFLKLSAKSVIMSKSACKLWYNLISDPGFANLHLAQAKACPLIGAVDKNLISRTLYLFDEPEDNAGLDLEDCLCEFGSDHFEKCGRCHINLKLNSKLKIPLRNAGLALDKQADFDATNPSNGLLCLSDPLSNEPVAICNPIKGEFVSLPKPRRCENDDTFIDCGLGFSPKNNQYKVFQPVPPPCFLEGGLMSYVSLGVLRGCLCVCAATSSFYPCDLWIMQEYGVGESWTNVVSIASGDERWAYGFYQPISFLNDGTLQMFHYPSNSLIYYHLKSLKFNYLKLHGLKSEYEAIAHVPSSALFKDILMGTNVEVLNINSRCGKLELPGETKGLLLEGKQEGDSSDSNSLYRKRELWYDYRWTKCSDINY